MENAVDAKEEEMFSEVVKLFKERKILTIDVIVEKTGLSLKDIEDIIHHLESMGKIEKIQFCNKCNGNCSSCSFFNSMTYRWKNFS